MPKKSSKRTSVTKAPLSTALKKAQAALLKKHPGYFIKPPERRRISTGSLTLDAALGGGVPEGGAIEFAGMPSAGKTTSALRLCGEACRSGGFALFLDYEHVTPADYAATISCLPVVALQQLSVARGERGLLIVQPNTLEDGAEILFSLSDALKDRLRAVVIDSVAMMSPSAMLEGDFDDVRPGLQALMVTKLMAWAAVRLPRYCTTTIVCNQLRADFSAKVSFKGGPAKKSAGPEALGHQLWQRVWLTPGAAPLWRPVFGETRQTYFRVVKNKTSPDILGRTHLVIEPGHGFSTEAEVIELGLQEGVLRGSVGGELLWAGGKYSADSLLTALRNTSEPETALPALVAQVRARFVDRRIAFDPRPAEDA